jgi:hypothetical protein
MRVTMPRHGFPEEFHCGFSIPALGHKGFQDFAFVIDGPPEVVGTPLISAETPSRCHRQWGRGRIRSTRLRRISAANIGPRRCHQNRTVSWLMSLPRFCSKSSTLRSQSG